jgi:hypothetical protein
LDSLQTSGKYFLHQISPLDSIEVIYDSAYNMKTIGIWDEKGDSLSTSELVYENGKLIKVIEDNDGGEMKLRESIEYNSAGKLAKATFYLSPSRDAISNYDSLIYDADGRLAELYELRPDPSGYTLRRKRVYTWDNKGNIVRELALNIYNMVPTDSAFTDYTYDDKVNYAPKQSEFFIMQPDQPTFGLSVNNVVKKVGSSSLTPDWSSVTTYEYTYDEDNYPITRKDLMQTIQGGQVQSSYEDSFRYRYITK